MNTQAKLPQIVIVGGGAGGLELATKLVKVVAKTHSLLLIDKSPTHLWKPLLHEVAAGTLNAEEDALNYLAFATDHHFQFCLGTLASLDRTHKTLTLSALNDESGIDMIPRRQISYDVLVLAVGSVSHDFGTPGVQDYCLQLDSRSDADHFQQCLIKHFMRLDYQNRYGTGEGKPLTIAVVGGGATGVELVAELYSAIRQASHSGLAIFLKDVQLTLIESNARLLPPLASAISAWALTQLQAMGVHVLLNTVVIEATNTGYLLQSSQFIEATMLVWAAGIKAPDVLKQLDGLAVNHLNQLIVKQTLQTTKDDAIFAFGDCASCPQTGSTSRVPSRAQAAHEQATFLVKALKQYINQVQLPDFHYRDYGSLVSLGEQKSIGSMQSGRLKIKLKGKIAYWAYLLLYKMHQIVLHGSWRVILLTLANKLSRSVKPRFKLH